MADTLEARINEDLRSAMKAKDAQRVSVLRLLRAQFTNEMIAKSVQELADNDVITILQREVKKRREAASSFRAAGREESAQSEEAEQRVIEEYLPPALDDAVIEGHVREAVQATGASSAADMGKVMPVVMGKVRGQADGARVRSIVERILASL